MNNLSHILNHLGEAREHYFRAMAPPVIQTSNFVLQDVAALRESVMDELHHHLYTRGNNPTVEILRKKLAALERTEDALVVGSGASAVTTAVLGLVRQGDHVVCVRHPYSWTRYLLDTFLPRFGVSADYVDGGRTEEIAAAIRPNTRLLILESPNTMTFGLQDLRACASLAREHGLISLVDNSCATPLYQQPATLGIDLVIHSVTKYLNGHSDVVAGAICGSADLIRQIFDQAFMVMGTLLSPQDAALVIRGLRTLPLRLSQSASSSLILADRLAGHPAVSHVLHPFRADFPQADLAREQMTGYGGLFAFYLHETDPLPIQRMVDRVTRFLLAVSWGGHESLIFPIAAMYDLPGRADPPYPANLIRLYVGLEDPDWLWADLESALNTLVKT